MVYVDNRRESAGAFVVSYMVASSAEELISMALRIGLKESWIKDKGTWSEHFEVVLSKKKLAIEHGAMEISSFEMDLMMAERRGGDPGDPTGEGMENLFSEWAANDHVDHINLGTQEVLFRRGGAPYLIPWTVFLDILAEEQRQPMEIYTASLIEVKAALVTRQDIEAYKLPDRHWLIA